jgi:cob(I)alamin adenosyltransferase
MKIYTRTGDGGETSFLDGGRVPKSALRVEAYGEVDELNASIGVARTESTHETIRDILDEVQQDLFSVGAILADPKGQLKSEKASLGPTHVEKLEAQIDELEGELPPLKQFVLPGGSKGGALLHHARSICRRAERKIVALSSNEPVPSIAVSYMNRLSDLLFVLARFENKHQNIQDRTW